MSESGTTEYHNPEMVPLDKIPHGWRLLFSNEKGAPISGDVAVWQEHSELWNFFNTEKSPVMEWTYIVPHAIAPVAEDDVYATTFHGHRLDPYRIAYLYDLDGIQLQILKKLLRRGRKHKTERQDMEEVRTSAVEWLAIDKELSPS